MHSRAALSLLALACLAACADATTEPATTPVPPIQNVPPDDPRPAVVALVELDAHAIAIDVGATWRVVATPRDSAGRALDGRAVTWTSSDPLTVAVSETGVVTALRPGVVTITATVDGRSADARVSVSAAYGYELLFDAPTGTYGQLPELWRLDIGASDAEAARVSPFSGASDVAVSPDGRRVAFVAHESGSTDIWVMNVDGSGRRAVTSTSDNDDQPVWSPDGTRIAFHRWSYIGTPHDVWVVNADGAGAANLTADLPGEQHTPTWSPRLADGTSRVAFADVTRGDDGYLRARLYTMRDDGADKRAITDGAHFDGEPAWSPDGRTIAFVRTGGEAMGDLWLVDADGTDARALMRDEEPPFDQRAPAWSPDGALIAYASHHEIIGNRAGDWQLYTVRADGTGVVRRTATSVDKANPAWLPR